MDEKETTRIEIPKTLRDKIVDLQRGRDTQGDVIQRLLDHYASTVAA